MDIQLNIQKKITSTLLIVLSIILYSCNTTEPGDSAELKLTVEDISCTEAWIKVAATGISSQSVIEIKADDKLVKQVSAAGTSIDSIIYIDSLLPGKAYRFSASMAKGNAAEATARTLDTTSHEFVWEEYTFGDYTSILRANIVRGNDVNDIFTAGNNGRLWHFNGVSWRNYNEISKTEDRLLSLSIKGNIIAVAGYRYINGIENFAVIHLGRR